MHTVVYYCVCITIIGTCTVNAIRLFDGTSASADSGIVQICNSSRIWSDVCDYAWNQCRSLLVCKQLGYSNTSKLQLHMYYCTACITSFFSCRAHY